MREAGPVMTRRISSEIVVDVRTPPLVPTVVVIGTGASSRWSSERDRCRCPRVMLAAEAKDLTAVAVAQLLVLFARPLGGLVITCVAGRATVFEWLAPVSGLTTSEAVRSSAVADAECCSRTSVSFVPKDIPVQHRVADCWAAALRMSWEYDALVLAAWPRNRLDRRAVSAFAARAGAQVTMPTTGTTAMPGHGARAGVTHRSH